MKALLLFLTSFCIMACDSSSDTKQKVKALALDNLELIVEAPQQLNITSVSEVDSAFGVSDFTEQELRLMFDATKALSNKIMYETNGFENLEATDPSLQELFDRQMKTTSEMRQLMMQQRKGQEAFSGYKLSIKYQCLLNGYPYKAIRWYFIDPKGLQVLKTYEIVLL